MEGLPSDIFDHDRKTFPMKDSQMEAKLKAQVRKAEVAEEAEAKRRGRPKGSTNAAKTAQKPPPPPAVAHRHGTIQEKTDKIRLYFHYLSHKISVSEPKTYPTTHEGLDSILSQIQCQLHGEGGIEKAGVMYVAAANGVEKLTQVWNPLGWNLSGPAVSLGQAVSANEDKWKDLVKEFAIEHARYFMFGPGKRLIATTVQLIMAVDQANKAVLRRGGPPKQVPEDLAKEAEDL